MMLQAKGGIGKSLTASMVVQYYLQTNRPVRAYDSDPLNASLVSVSGLGATAIALLDEDTIAVKTADDFVETLLTSSEDVVLDNGAASFLPVCRYLVETEVAELLDAAGRELILHVVIAGGGSILDTMKGMEALVRHFPECVKLVIWVNEYFGPVRADGIAFEDTKLYRDSEARILGLVRLKQWNPRTFGANLAALLERKMTFAEALTGTTFNTVERQRLVMIQREIFDQLASVLG